MPPLTHRTARGPPTRPTTALGSTPFRCMESHIMSTTRKYHTRPDDTLDFGKPIHPDLRRQCQRFYRSHQRLPTGPRPFLRGRGHRL
jgi:hypothetical protein